MSERHPRLAEQFIELEQQREAARLGIWVFIATEVLFFGTLFASYLISRVRAPESFMEAGKHAKLLLGSVNTFILFTSCLTMTLAVRSIRLDRQRGTLRWLVTTALLGIGFVGLKAYEYYKDFKDGTVPGAHFILPHNGQEIFFFMYFMLTGAHVIHLLVGIGIVSFMIWRVRRGAFSSTWHSPLEVTSLYWHFVDIVWTFIFPLVYLLGRS